MVTASSRNKNKLKKTQRHEATVKLLSQGKQRNIFYFEKLKRQVHSQVGAESDSRRDCIV